MSGQLPDELPPGWEDLGREDAEALAPPRRSEGAGAAPGGVHPGPGRGIRRRHRRHLDRRGGGGSWRARAQRGGAGTGGSRSDRAGRGAAREEGHRAGAGRGGDRRRRNRGRARGPLGAGPEPGGDGGTARRARPSLARKRCRPPNLPRQVCPARSCSRAVGTGHARRRALAARPGAPGHRLRASSVRAAIPALPPRSAVPRRSARRGARGARHPPAGPRGARGRGAGACGAVPEGSIRAASSSRASPMRWESGGEGGVAPRRRAGSRWRWDARWTSSSARTSSETQERTLERTRGPMRGPRSAQAPGPSCNPVCGAQICNAGCSGLQDCVISCPGTSCSFSCERSAQTCNPDLRPRTVPDGLPARRRAGQLHHDLQPATDLCCRLPQRHLHRRLWGPQAGDHL